MTSWCHDVITVILSVYGHRKVLFDIQSVTCLYALHDYHGLYNLQHANFNMFLPMRIRARIASTNIMNHFYITDHVKKYVLSKFTHNFIHDLNIAMPFVYNFSTLQATFLRSRDLAVPSPQPAFLRSYNRPLGWSDRSMSYISSPPTRDQTQNRKSIHVYTYIIYRWVSARKT